MIAILIKALEAITRIVFSKSGGHIFEKNTIYLCCIRTQSETKYFRHTHQVKKSKANTELHEIEYYLEYNLRKVNFKQFPISNVQGVLFCKFTI